MTQPVLMKRLDLKRIQNATSAEVAAAGDLATASLQGMLSAADKGKLDTISASGGIKTVTGDTTLVSGDNGATIINDGASGIVNVTLTSATVGRTFYALITTLQILKFLSVDGNDTIIYGVSGLTGAKIYNNVVGAKLTIRCVKVGFWHVTDGLEDSWSIGN